MVGDLRSALALAPDRYFEWVADGTIEPRRAVVSRFVPTGLALENGEQVDCDLAVLALGSKTPVFPFFEPPFRELLEDHEDGVQLFRHILHPRIPGVAFAGFNHGFLHVPAAEVAALWVGALWRGDLTLPALETMEHEIEQVRAWKRAHVNFEPSRSCAVNTRFQQHIDLMLRDLGLSPYRKLPNLFAEAFCRYGPLDYAGLVEEYRGCQKRSLKPQRLLPLAG